MALYWIDLYNCPALIIGQWITNSLFQVELFDLAYILAIVTKGFELNIVICIWNFVI